MRLQNIKTTKIRLFVINMRKNQFSNSQHKNILQLRKNMNDSTLPLINIDIIQFDIRRLQQTPINN